MTDDPWRESLPDWLYRIVWWLCDSDQVTGAQIIEGLVNSRCQMLPVHNDLSLFLLSDVRFSCMSPAVPIHTTSGSGWCLVVLFNELYRLISIVCIVQHSMILRSVKINKRNINATLGTYKENKIKTMILNIFTDVASHPSSWHKVWPSPRFPSITGIFQGTEREAIKIDS